MNNGIRAAITGGLIRRSPPTPPEGGFLNGWLWYSLIDTISVWPGMSFQNGLLFMTDILHYQESMILC